MNRSEVEKQIKQQVCINGKVNTHTTCETREHPGGQLQRERGGFREQNVARYYLKKKRRMEKTGRIVTEKLN